VVFCTNTSQVGAIFVYCKTGAGGKLVNEEDGVGCIIGFYSWQLLMFDWKSQKRKLFLLIACTKSSFITKELMTLFVYKN